MVPGRNAFAGQCGKRAAQISDVALVIIGRTAGEDQDTKAEPGSYLLTEEEEAMIRTVSRHFTRTAVLLNVGNIIDMKWVETCKPSAVLYVWQGGMEGGSGVADVLTGRVKPLRPSERYYRPFHRRLPVLLLLWRSVQEFLYGRHLRGIPLF